MPLLSCPHIELSGQLKKANNADLTFYIHTTQTTFHRVGTMQCLYKLYLICWYVFCQLLLIVVFPSCINSHQKKATQTLFLQFWICNLFVKQSTFSNLIVIASWNIWGLYKMDASKSSLASTFQSPPPTHQLKFPLLCSQRATASRLLPQSHHPPLLEWRGRGVKQEREQLGITALHWCCF